MSNALPTRRRWLRMSLRTLLAIVTIFGIWLGFQVAAARKQRDALRALAASGHWTIHFDYQCQPAPTPNASYQIQLNPKAALPGPEWLQRLAGEDFFRTAWTASWDDLADKPIQESDLARLGELTELRILGIGRATIQRNGSNTARGLSDSDLAAFSGLKKLEQLQLFGIEIHEPGLRSIAHLKNLKSLELDLTETGSDDRKLLDNSGMKSIGELTDLEYLELTRARFEKDALTYLAALNKLEGLQLYRCAGLDAAGLKELGKLPRLKYLNLHASDVSDSALEQLQLLSRLVLLDLGGGTEMSPEGIAKLRELLPKSVDVHVGP